MKIDKKYVITYSTLWYYTGKYWNRWSNNELDAKLYYNLEKAKSDMQKLAVLKPSQLRVLYDFRI